MRTDGEDGRQSKDGGILGDHGQSGGFRSEEEVDHAREGGLRFEADIVERALDGWVLEGADDEATVDEELRKGREISGAEVHSELGMLTRIHRAGLLIQSVVEKNSSSLSLVHCIT